MSAAPWGWSRAAGARVWRGARRRWLLGGVLAALLAAVLAPRTGAPGGGLRAEYSSWALVSYVHFSAGRRARGSEGACGKDARVAAACAAHAHLVSPALTAALLTALTDGVDYRIVKGVMLWSLGGGCAWLPLAFCAGGARGAGLAAPGGCALVYAASLLATPLHTAMLAGRCRARRVACAGCRACSWRPRRRCCWRRWRPPPAPTATTSCCPATTTCCSPASSEAPRPPQHVTTRRSQSAQRPCS